MKITKSNQAIVKVSETVLARMLARMLGVAQSDTITDVTDAYADLPTACPHLTQFTRCVAGPYTWTVDVAGEVMSDRLTMLQEHLLSLPGYVYVAKDSVRSGELSVWFVVAGPTDDMLRSLGYMKVKGVFHTLQVGDTHCQVLAFQLSTCALKQ